MTWLWDALCALGAMTILLTLGIVGTLAWEIWEATRGG